MRLHQDGHQQEATFAYARAERAGDVDAGFNLGVLHYESGDLDAAEAAWRRCVAREHPQAATNLAFLLQRRGDDRGARELYEDASRWGDALAARMLARPSVGSDARPSAQDGAGADEAAPALSRPAGLVDGGRDRRDT